MAIFGGYVNPTQAVSAAAKNEITANLDRLAALIPTPGNPPNDPVTGASPQPPHTDFNKIGPAVAFQLRAEIAYLRNLIATGP